MPPVLKESKQDPDRNSTKTGNPPTCVASTSTGAFALQTSDGKVYKLDPAGNSKAATALRGNPDNKSPEADVAGVMQGEILIGGFDQRPASGQNGLGDCLVPVRVLDANGQRYFARRTIGSVTR